MINDEFADIRPYYDTEISDAMHRIASDPLLEHVANYLMPNKPIEEVQALFRSLCSIDDFQRNIMYHAVKTIERNSTFGLEVMGFEQLTPGECYLFVSNHRDIVLDSAFLQAAMYDNGRPTTEITFGSNLMKPQFVVDFGKSNKMFKVTRSSSMREFLINSMHLSRYMRTKIENKEESIWIAQRNGRTKDGCDATEQGIIKMFNMSGTEDVISNIRSLNIVPISISYQIEPCDSLKALELYKSSLGKYEKSPMEDLNSILSGILQPKGKVTLRLMPCINEELERLNGLTKNDLYRAIAEIIDNSIYAGYELYDTNYIAHDLLYNAQTYMQHYTVESKADFIAMMESKLSELPMCNDDIKERYLRIYASPVDNVKG